MEHPVPYTGRMGGASTMSREWVKDMFQRARAGFQRRDQMRSLYEAAMKLGSPGRVGWEATGEGEVQIGKAVQRNVYESTFQSATLRLANGLFMGMTPPSATWIEYIAGTQVPSEMAPEVKAKLARPTQVAAQTLWESMFYSQWLPFLHDFVYGTAVLLVDEANEFDRHPTNFQTLPLHEIGLEEDHRGQIAGVFREHAIRARHVPSYFEDVDLPPEITNRVSNSPETMLRFTSCFVQMGGEWCQCVLYKGLDRPVMVRRFNEQPVTVARTGVLSGECYGRGPALNVSATAYSLNELARLTLIAAEMSVFGMYTLDDDSVNPSKVKWSPGGMIKVRSNASQKPSLKPLENSARLDWAKAVSEDLKSQLQRMLYRDVLGNVEGPKMTLGEVMERQKMVMQDLGALGTSLNDTGLSPTITRHTAVLSRRGRLPPGLKIDGKMVALRYVSPFVRAQALEEVAAIRALAGDAQMLAQTDPGAKVWVDSRRVLVGIADKTGVPLEYLRTSEQGQQILQQLAVAQATAAGEAPGGEADTALADQIGGALAA